VSLVPHGTGEGLLTPQRLLSPDMVLSHGYQSGSKSAGLILSGG
jgi:hypothetical protein